MEAARRWQETPGSFPPEVDAALATLAPHPVSEAQLLMALPEYHVSIAGEGFDSRMSRSSWIFGDGGPGVMVTR
jgi:hypothetical protein